MSHDKSLLATRSMLQLAAAGQDIVAAVGEQPANHAQNVTAGLGKAAVW